MFNIDKIIFYQNVIWSFYCSKKALQEKLGGLGTHNQIQTNSL